MEYQFSSSNLDDLFGPSLVEKPLLQSQVTWQQVAVVGGIIIVTVAVTGFVVYKATKRNQEQFMSDLRDSKKHSEQTLESEEEDIVDKVFRRNGYKNSNPKSTAYGIQ